MLKRHHYGPSYGLLNSCQFVAEALRSRGFEAKIAEVVDNNSVDREVAHYKPTHVIVEALWVVPSKFPELLQLHPEVQWIVRIHSNIPFLSGEGMAIHWLNEYRDIAARFDNFSVACNSRRMASELELALGLDAAYLPNIYADSLFHKPLVYTPERRRDSFIDIGCFGAIRPLKNQLEQAVAAVIFARATGRPLRFHVNSTRVEQNSDPILRNLIALFKSGENEIVQHPWLPHNEFIEVLRRMDYGLQVSFSETFNIVAADFVYNEIPFVGSREIEWLMPHSAADATNWESIVDRLCKSTDHHLMRTNKELLREFSEKALHDWLNYLAL